jgi:hypothetical protein
MIARQDRDREEDMAYDEDTNEQSKFTIFRGAQAPHLKDTQLISTVVATPEQREGMAQMSAAGWGAGDETRVVFNAPGFSLIHLWFKKDYPLPLHSHDADCLYFVVAGSLTLGTETLGPGDGFFIPANARYTYRPGPDGVEVLEFRHATQVDFRLFGTSNNFFAKSLETIAANRADWETAKRPSAADA